MTRSPAFTSSADAGARARQANRTAAAIARNEALWICTCVLLSLISDREMNCGMQRAEHPDNGENGKAEGKLDGAVAQEQAERAVSGPPQPRRQHQPVGQGERQHDDEQG